MTNLKSDSFNDRIHLNEILMDPSKESKIAEKTEKTEKTESKTLMFGGLRSINESNPNPLLKLNGVFDKDKLMNQEPKEKTNEGGLFKLQPVINTIESNEKKINLNSEPTKTSDDHKPTMFGNLMSIANTNSLFKAPVLNNQIDNNKQIDSEKKSNLSNFSSFLSKSSPSDVNSNNKPINLESNNQKITPFSSSSNDSKQINTNSNPPTNTLFNNNNTGTNFSSFLNNNNNTKETKEQMPLFGGTSVINNKIDENQANNLKGSKSTLFSNINASQSIFANSNATENIGGGLFGGFAAGGLFANQNKVSGGLFGSVEQQTKK